MRERAENELGWRSVHDLCGTVQRDFKEGQWRVVSGTSLENEFLEAVRSRKKTWACPTWKRQMPRHLSFGDGGEILFPVPVGQFFGRAEHWCFYRGGGLRSR